MSDALVRQEGAAKWHGKRQLGPKYSNGIVVLVVNTGLVFSDEQYTVEKRWIGALCKILDSKSCRLNPFPDA
jgi:hypothetical protein